MELSRPARADIANHLINSSLCGTAWIGIICQILSKEFGGQELSGGQWQRLAIARGLYRDGTLLFLDEPTAAIDALEEKALYEMFAQAAKGRTCVLITHRLGAARIADRILVMKAGRLLADGTHAQLLRDCPEYRRLYDAQSESYRQADGPAEETGTTVPAGGWR